MDNKPNYIAIAISILVVVFAVIVLITMVQRNANTGSSAGENSIAPEEAQPPTSTSTSSAPRPPSQTSKSAAISSPKISVLSPTQADTWVISQNNVIRWSAEAKFPGSIYLTRAADKSIVGWIISEIGPHQTSYTWDTRDVFLSRYNPAKKNLETGTYILKIKFDSKIMPEIASAPFSIIYPSEVQIPIYDVHIKEFKFNPAALTLKKGDKIRFTNEDSVEHRLLLSSFSPFTVAPGQTITFDTAVFRSGFAYDFYSDLYSTMTLKVMVQ